MSERWKGAEFELRPVELIGGPADGHTTQMPGQPHRIIVPRASSDPTARRLSYVRRPWSDADPDAPHPYDYEPPEEE